MLIDLGKDGSILAEASWQDGPKESSPALFLLHGLEGSARSHHLLGISKKAFEAGFHTIRVNMRNCGGTERLTPTLYCAGLSQDVFAVVRALRERCGISRIYGAGVSLGANVLLKFLGEQGMDAFRLVQGAAAVSTPIDLALGARTIGRPESWFYERYFVRQLVARIERKTAFFDGLADLSRVRRIRSIYEFDDVVTAPHFGFGSADNYYRLASSGPLLREIRVPTLLVQATDDPLIPFESYKNIGIGENASLVLLVTEHGGHAGFLGARPASDVDLDRYWAECRVVQFLTALAF
jgi:predicted alpha/beta-fold hydrolase